MGYCQGFGYQPDKHRHKPGVKEIKKTVFVSLISHIAVFSVFSLSFGNKIPRLDCAVSFWGRLWHSPQLEPAGLSPYKESGCVKNLFSARADTAALEKIDKGVFLLEKAYLKPAASLAFNTEKAAFAEGPLPLPPALRSSAPAIIFHPLLPYSFTLYFKDRQTAHVELMFKISAQDHRSFAVIKRKVSSGNLEVDLLSARYIERYLFMQRAGFDPEKWQTVKIDLSAKE